VNVLIACEESQTVLKEFLKRGHNAYSNDVVKCSGGCETGTSSWTPCRSLTAE
jgi:hypothetical protein